ncbi:MAG: adenine deaminase [Bacteriovoracaceae bacterium]|nr:adenine deaminase [Bacteriovoracaceae bacterium]
MGDKNTQQLTSIELKDALAVARGDKAADLLIKNVKIMDLVNGGINDSAIVISGKTIAGIGSEYRNAKTVKEWDAKGLIAVPGFIDGHLHMESSLMHPFEFERVTLPLGTTSIIGDPHEITNVLGEDGFSWFLRSAKLMHQNFFLQVSSCIPALPGFETNGADWTLEHMKKFVDDPYTLGMAEMMNFPGVILGNDEILDRLELFKGLNLDGHSPLLRGKELCAYICSGIQNCHESVLQEEALEKLQKGMSVMIREGTVAKNLNMIAPIVNEFNSSSCFLCTDDRNPSDIFKEGHINFMVKKLIQEVKLPAHIAYRLASFSAATHYGLKRLGFIAPGKQADIVLLSDQSLVAIEDVILKGQRVSEINFKAKTQQLLKESAPPTANTIKRKKVTATDFALSLSKGTYNVIEIIPEEIITNNSQVAHDGNKFEEEDILKIAVVERYGNEFKPSIGLVQGTGIKSGALASSVAHDSHNLIVIGTNDADMAYAVNTLIDSGGGFCVVQGQQVKSLLELPIAGLMSLESAEVIANKIDELAKEFSKLGVVLKEPFLQMAFLALPVIPALKITDKGIFDVSRFQFTTLKVDDLD